jgi:hypothetical protein
VDVTSPRSYGAVVTRRTPRAAAITLAFCVLALGGPARADEADDVYRAASRAEEERRYAEALEGYRRALALRPSASFAIRARIRADDLAAHAEGDFRPLQRLDAVRRDPHATSDRASLSSLMADARQFPPGRVRGEAFLLVAEGFLRRLHLPELALEPATLLADDPSFDRVTRRQGLAMWVDALEAMGHVEEARRVGASHAALSPELAQRKLNEGRRVVLGRVAQAALGLILGAASFAAFRLRQRGRLGAVARRLVSFSSLIAALAVAGGGALVSWLYDPTTSVRPFVLLGGLVLLVDRAVALFRAGTGDRGGPRAIALFGGLLGVAAAAILALLWSDPAFLTSFGL